MPLLTTPALPDGAMAATRQPDLPLPVGGWLRPWRDDDAPAVRRAHDDPAIRRFHCRTMADDDEAREWIGWWSDAWTEERAASWAVADSGGLVLGQVGLRTISLFEGEAQLSYWLAPEARGRGVAACAVSTLTAWAFEVLGLQRLALRHSTANAASCRVAAAAGYELEGTMRRAGRHTDGWHDMHLHARLASDSSGS